MKNIKLILLLGTLVAGTVQAMDEPKPAEKPRDELLDMSYFSVCLMFGAAGAAAGAWHTGEALKKYLPEGAPLTAARGVGMLAFGTIGCGMAVLYKFQHRNT
jgi:hypothetical protein